MSYEIGRDALNLRWTERVARAEYVDNWEVVRHFTGKDPRQDGGAWAEFYDAIHVDFIWHTDDGPGGWGHAGRTTNMGHAVYMEDGSDFKAMVPSPFRNSGEVLAFSAVAEYGRPDMKGLVAYYEQCYQSLRAAHPNQVVTGGFYNTVVSGAIQAFGWEMLLEAAGDDPDRFGEDVLGSIFELTMHYATAWAQTSIDFYMCHDDMVWTQGPFMNPTFYRKYVFPRYQELWAMLHAAGKKVLFTSDGKFDMFIDELVEAGADGLCFEPDNDLELLVRKCGQTHALIGGADCRTLTFGTKADIEKEMRWVLDVTKNCPGFMFATGNHFPANIPLENALHYFELIDTLGRRDRAG